ncbi:MAG: hypothetical protein DMG84_13345 [Acidobacteria bacterium]|jgi:hypothetical protein|nr:MAG: hypothetical protein DMG84_13345 [Acidobacteriota bacterium]
MAKKRELVWIETPGFMGWGCNLCSWKYQIPQAATSKAPSLETRSAFLHHRCAPASKHMDVRWNDEIQEWFCAKCGRTSDHITKDDALIELEPYECELLSTTAANRRS